MRPGKEQGGEKRRQTKNKKRWKKRIEDEWPKRVSTKKAFQVSLFLKT